VSENAIEAQITLHHAVNCDPKRIAQVASNLVANALKHGAPDQPIRVLASTNEQRVSTWRSRTRVSRSTQLSCDSSFSRFLAVARRTRSRSRPLHRVRNRSRSWRADRRCLRRDSIYSAHSPHLSSKAAAPRLTFIGYRRLIGLPLPSHSCSRIRLCYWCSTLARCLRRLTGISTVSEEVDRLRIRISRLSTSRFSTTSASSSTGMMVTPSPF
jgi:hypothetical protein